ncbi:hypothetical protein CfE428DRAFT_3425 [Chthoniobacter flavus Ellin428]|uniref:Uncharacterized protein n=1 Tax=Chthoniobacter flavus Ellin428 TaxID=497964 RepID=B4D3D7_9BACT|nr:hypothetical protein [Chthoniobacter flavus]EDY19248.1 hypothetical protein CfE428DRAFT_3425 [Chthoniobacter flavus Ellin428]TCO88091.1 hypothetical protein EV701_119135 [Chthoniobacter flavus]
MNRRSILAFFLVGSAAILHAQDKATPKGSKADKGEPKVLTFQSTKLPDVVADSGGTPGETAQHATANPMADGPSQIVANFFAALEGGKIDEGYAALTKDSKIAEKPDELKQLKTKTREAIEVFGAIVGYDFVEAHAVGERLVRATYVSQGKVFPLRWRFYFYKPENSWRLIDMRVDDKLTGIFDEAAEVGKPDDLKAPGASKLP